MQRTAPIQRDSRTGVVARAILTLATLGVAGVLLWQAVAAHGYPDPLARGASGTAVVDIGVLVFREGLESILVLAAITASMVGAAERYRVPVALGAMAGFAASVVTWKIAVGVVQALSRSMSALDVQALTGLLAIVVLLFVMNWFFHRIYWTGWISTHTRRKKALLDRAETPGASRWRILAGLVLLGFTSVYREGVEVVLFLQTYRMRLGAPPVLQGVLVGLALTGVVAVLTFLAHRRLPYKKMLVLTGVLLGVVLLVMAGEQAQEMQLAHWLPTTPIPALLGTIPRWLQLWFAVFPTVETLAAQILAGGLVLGSYAIVRHQIARTARRAESVAG